jgi:hypothetical protein
LGIFDTFFSKKEVPIPDEAQRASLETTGNYKHKLIVIVNSYSWATWLWAQRNFETRFAGRGTRKSWFAGLGPELNADKI